MHKATSRLTSRGRTTIPKAARKALGVSEGDDLLYSIHRDYVIVAKAPGLGARDAPALFSEWASENDSRAFRSL